MHRDIATCVKRAPWVLKELIVDAKLQEWNKLYGGGRMFRYLTRRVGSAEAVLGLLRAVIHASGQPYDWPLTGTAAQKTYILRMHMGAVEEMAFRAKLEEAAILCVSRRRMYRWLKARYGIGGLLSPVRSCSMRGPVRSVLLTELPGI